MDATPGTLHFPERVHETYSQAPDALFSSLKLVVILRDPVSRQLSWYNHQIREYMATKTIYADHVVSFANGTIMSFDQYIDIISKERLFKKGWKWTGRYVDHLKKWTNLFGRDKLLVLSYDELHQDQKKVQWCIWEFLGGKFPGRLPRINTKGNLTAEISDCVIRSWSLGILQRMRSCISSLIVTKGRGWKNAHSGDLMITGDEKQDSDSSSACTDAFVSRMVCECC